MWAAGATCLAPDPPSLWPQPWDELRGAGGSCLLEEVGTPTPTPTPPPVQSESPACGAVEAVPTQGEVAPAAGSYLGHLHLSSDLATSTCLAKSEMFLSQVVIFKLARALISSSAKSCASGGSRPRCRSELGGGGWKSSPLSISIQAKSLLTVVLRAWLTVWGSF